MKKYPLILITGLAILLRLILSIVNESYNDDHVTPVVLWIKNGLIPGNFDCWECFQPPFFYWVIKIIAGVFGLSSFEEILNVIRTLNFLISTGILLLIINIIYTLEINNLLKFPLIVFWTLNPELISIGALNSNDTLLILLGCICYLLMLKYYKSASWRLEILIGFILFLLGITKGNGLIYLFCFGALCLINLSYKVYKIRDVFRLVLVFSLVTVSISLIGGYYSNYITHGTPFVTNLPKQPAPNLFEADTLDIGRRGVTSISETFFTFQLKSLLKEPFNSNGWTEYPKHRTSFFSQLYGQFNNYFFEFHPNTWRSGNNDMKNFVRVNYILQLPLLLLFILEFLGRIVRILKRKISMPEIDVIILIIYLIFLIKYSITYRDFSCMKLIFVFPALLSMISIFSRSIDRVKWTKAISWLIYSSTLLYIVNYIYLIGVLL